MGRKENYTTTAIPGEIFTQNTEGRLAGSRNLETDLKKSNHFLQIESTIFKLHIQKCGQLFQCTKMSYPSLLLRLSEI